MTRDRGMAVTDVMSREECETLAKKVFSFAPADTKIEVKLASGMGVSTRFARSETQMATETGGATIAVRLDATDRKGGANGSRLDDDGLRQLMAVADAASREWRGTPKVRALPGPKRYKTPPKLFFDANLPLMTPDGRGAFMAAALDATDAAGLMGAGSITLARGSYAVVNTEGLFGYIKSTAGSFSLTARTKDGTGSGWAWSGHEDWSKVDVAGAIARAVDLGQRSRKPVAIEPGRYTVILEPAAVAALIETINWDAAEADFGRSPFSRDPIGNNKIGLQMLDRRLNMVSDPWDSDAPRPTLNQDGEPLDKVQWFQDGVLKNLYYGTWYAKQKNRAPVMGPENIRLYGQGPTQTLDEMIASTKRGVWVNRLTSLGRMNERTGLLTGTTRDGTFLIENGKITKAIKNFRFTESPFFVFNKLEAFGEPVRASSMAVAPRMKVRDFDFTSLTDAI